MSIFWQRPPLFHRCHLKVNFLPSKFLYKKRIRAAKEKVRLVGILLWMAAYSNKLGNTLTLNLEIEFNAILDRLWIINGFLNRSKTSSAKTVELFLGHWKGMVYFIKDGIIHKCACKGVVYGLLYRGVFHIKGKKVPLRYVHRLIFEPFFVL